MPSSEMLRYVSLVRIDVSEERIANKVEYLFAACFGF
jgi:hypothetical protein